MDLEDTENIPKGWYIATYKNAPLGWLKAAAGRLKNHYPIHWRIRNI
jgi:NOL1/NOP2/fmu family ribosome biogenesis protein